MNCKKAGGISADRLTGAFSVTDKAEYLEHLKGCGSCRKEAELLSKSWQALAMYETPAPGGEFVDSLMAKIRAGQAEAQSPVFSFKPFGFSAEARAALAGWWKVPALTLASCAVYLVCIETGLTQKIR